MRIESRTQNLLNALMKKIRIIGGKWRGKKIAVPELYTPPQPPTAYCLRPSTDRTRTTLFNWLRHLDALDETTNALDLFCGTGILGLEALSHGIFQADFVDNHHKILQHLQQNAQNLSTKPTEQIRVHLDDGLHFLAHAAPTWDMIFCDPPYHSTDYATLLCALKPRLKRTGLLYLESPYPLETLVIAQNYQLVRSKCISRTYLHLLTHANAKIS